MTPPARAPRRVAWFHCFAGIAGTWPWDRWSTPVPTSTRSAPCSTVWPCRAGTSSSRRHPRRHRLYPRHRRGRRRRGADPRRDRRPHRRRRPPGRVTARAQAVFHKLAAVESALHRRPIDQVHFHEVGGHDAIIDVVGTAAALEVLGVDEVSAPPPSPREPAWSGARTAGCPTPHRRPSACSRASPPTAATSPLSSPRPTGAALLAALSSAFGPLPDMTVTSSGFGGGAGEMDDLPNCTQVVIGHRSPRRPIGRGQGAVCSRRTSTT